MSKDRKCYIVGAGRETALDFERSGDDLVIAADGGYNYLKKYNIKPDLFIGDLDSADGLPDGCETVLLNPEKDDTDMLSAIKEGMRRGCNEFFLYCAEGGRLDHTVANIQCLNFIAEKNMKGSIIADSLVITVLKNGTMLFDKSCKGIISVFSLSEQSFGVTLQGLKYPLDGYTMTNLYPIGVSNQFTGNAASVSVKDGTLLIIYEK